VESLRQAFWRGIPFDMRSQIWKLLLGYSPKALDNREAVLKQKPLSELFKKHVNNSATS